MPPSLQGGWILSRCPCRYASLWESCCRSSARLKRWLGAQPASHPLLTSSPKTSSTTRRTPQNPKCKCTNPNPSSCAGPPAESPKEDSDNNRRCQDCGLGGEHSKPALDRCEKEKIWEFFLTVFCWERGSSLPLHVQAMDEVVDVPGPTME